MALPTITFNKGQGGLGRPLSGQDYVSGLLFYTANGNLPSGWTTSSRVKALYSVQDAINSGILPAYNKNNQYADTNYADATAAQSTIVLVRGATGYTINLKVTTLQRTVVNNIASISPVVVNLGTYTQTSGDSTLALLGASVAAFINANTYTHGFSAAFATATLTLYFPKSQGTYPNSGSPVVATVTGAITATITQPSAATPGTQSLQAIWYYHISEFFRIQPKGQLYVGFYAVPSPYLFTEITLMQKLVKIPKMRIKDSGRVTTVINRRFPRPRPAHTVYRSLFDKLLPVRSFLPRGYAVPCHNGCSHSKLPGRSR